MAVASEPPSPEEALAAFVTEPGVKIELVAAEPEVVDPVAMAFDELGRLFVVENRGYPSGPQMGRIALLEDEDGDGRYETRHEYVDEGLTFPNGIMCWNGGVYVTCAPDLLYFGGSNDDGRAGARHVVLTGFETNKSTQLRVNDPTLGQDGMIYLASGLSGGKVRPPTGHGVVDLAGGDLRFDPQPFLHFERVDGKCQYGHAFDEAGDRFICMNRKQAQHVVLDAAVLKRNPRLRFSETVQNMAEEDTVEDLLRGQNAAARIYPVSSNVTTADSHAGTFSAACAVTIWEGGVYSCDPTGNLVHRDALIPNGASFIARRSEEKREFVASKDDWCRPVFLALGPDGALYFCDMYRETIEHPDYLPKEVRKRMDFEGGKDRGRIYRVYREKKKSVLAGDPNLKPETLCRGLSSPNPWDRETCYRLLLERRERAALQPLLKEPLSPYAVALLVHKYSNRGLETMERALRDKDANVRLAGLRWFLNAEKKDDYYDAIRTMADDPNARIRMWCALVIGQIAVEDGQTLGRILMAAPDCRWTRAAVLSSAHEKHAGIMKALLSRSEIDEHVSLMAEAGAALPLEHRDAFVKQVCAIERESAIAWQIGFLNELEAADRIPERMRVAARKIAESEDATLVARKHALSALTGWGARDVALCWLKSDAPLELKRAGVQKLGEVGGLDELLGAEYWGSFSPSMRSTVVAAFLRSAKQAEILVEALESGRVKAALLDAGQRKRLIKLTGERAEKVFASLGGERMKIYEEWKEVVSTKGERESGRTVFKTLCMTCHRLEGDGWNVGPDLFGIRNQPKEAILMHIIVPNREIMPGFAGVVVETKDGKTHSGLLGSETEGSVTLRQPVGVEMTLLRSDIAKITASEASLMPEGLEQATTRQQMADLLAFLKGE